MVIGCYARKVARGVVLLDRDQPNWHRKIVRKINICSAHDCVLGQVYGDYFVGKRTLGLDQLSSMRHGFFATRVFSQRRFNRIWARVIRARQAADPERSTVSITK